MHQHKSAILLSGGIDSISLAYWKKPDFAITIDYGQKPASAEIHSASQVCNELSIKHEIIKIDCSPLGSGDLNGETPLSIAPVTEWWPYRNQLLITFACMKCVSLGVSELLLGSVSSDGIHKDGSKRFYELINDTVKFQEGNISVFCPAIEMESVELIRHSKIPYSVLLWAHSCHKSNHPCMECNGCKKYLSVMQELGLD